MKAAVTRFEKAVRAHEMKGAAHPGDLFAIEREYEMAKASLLNKLEYAIGIAGE